MDGIGRVESGTETEQLPMYENLILGCHCDAYMDVGSRATHGAVADKPTPLILLLFIKRDRCHFHSACK